MKVIVIDRVYGAGGHTVGQKVADELGIELYDRDIIGRAAELSGISKKELAKQEEEISLGTAILNAINPLSYDLKDDVFYNECQVVLDIASKGPCVIIGRCASFILAEAGIEALDVFLYGSPQNRVATVGKLLKLEDEKEILKAMKKQDTHRKSYNEHYTDRNWGDPTDYDLFLNSGTLGFDYCVEAIVNAARLDD